MSAFNKAREILSTQPRDSSILESLRIDGWIITELASSSVDVFIASVILDPYIWSDDRGLSHRVESILSDNLKLFGDMIHKHRREGGSCDDILDVASEALIEKVAKSFYESPQELLEHLHDDPSSPPPLPSPPAPPSSICEWLKQYIHDDGIIWDGGVGVLRYNV